MSIADTASRLLAVNGDPVQFSYTSGGSYDPSVGGIVGGSQVFVDGNGYPSSYNSNSINGTSIQSGDVRLICERLSERPSAQGWQCLVDGLDYKVMDVQPVRKSGQDIIYIVQLRK